MELAAVFNPTQATSGQFIASTLQAGSTMIVINKSYVDLIFTFTSGDQRLVIANDRRAFVFADASSVPGPLINWKQENIDYPQTINQLQNLVYVEIYAPTEKVAETYPSNIQRETLPSLIPYNVGYGVGVADFGHNNNPAVIWPTSYYGVTTAPKVTQFGTSINGMGFDYFWTESNMTAASPIMTSLPGNYSTTQKNINNATLNNAALASNIPGPFSQPGLTPVDSATYLNNTHWNTAKIITWSTATNGVFIDCWVMIPSYPTSVEWIWGDENVVSTNKGVSLEINNLGQLVLRMGNGTTHAAMTSNKQLMPNTWYYVAAQYQSGASAVSIFINGAIDISQSFTGPVATGTNTFGIGTQTAQGGDFVGSIANIGILLNNPSSTPWGVNTVQARYLLGQQSLNVDIQNAWITEIELIHQTGATATTGVSSVILDDIWNSGGQLYANVPVNVNALHIWRDTVPNSPIWSFGVQQPNTTVTLIDRFEKPLTHVFDEFPILENINISSVAVVTATVRGYNILGVG